MTNEKLLKKAIQESGKKVGFLADRCHLSRQGFQNCVKNKARFNTFHIEVLCDELSINTLQDKDAVFFATSDSLNESSNR